MSQIHYDHLSLEELVASAQYVLVVRPDEPPVRTVDEPIEGPGFDGHDVPPFAYQVQRYQVTEALRGVAAGSIAVLPASLDWMRDLHRQYYVDGISAHPIYRSYLPRTQPDEDGACVVFLNREGAGYEFAAMNSIEGFELVEEIRQLLAHRPPSSGVVTSSRQRPRWLEHVRTAFRLLATAGFVMAGFAHFASPEPFLAMMPTVLPFPLALVYISGAAEILGGVGLLVPATRRIAALGLIALLIAVFPANINMAVNEIYLEGMAHEPGLLWARLPFQLVFVALVYWTGVRD